MSILSKLQALLTAANTTTGESDTTLTAAMQNLIDGYGQGGGGYDVSDIGAKIEPSGAIILTKAPVSYAFRDCTNITAVHAVGLNITTLTDAFYGCTGIVTAVIGTVNNNAAITSFRACTNLATLDIDAVRLRTQMLFGCTSLSTIILRHETVTALENINVFTQTPFDSSGSGGTIYVPSDLITSYQADSNWSTILGYTNNQIKSIESTHTDPNAPIDLTLYYADGTPIT